MKTVGDFEKRIVQFLNRATLFGRSGGRRGFLTSIAKGFALITGLSAGLPYIAAGPATSGRMRKLIDEDWRFIKGEE